jgi:hypothetical protein
MIFGTDPSWLSDLGDRKGSRLFSIGIPSSSIAGIKQDLRDAGVTESVVYPEPRSLLKIPFTQRVDHSKKRMLRLRLAV